MKGKEFRQDQKGSAIIMVIIVMAFIGILVAIIMWMSMTNYLMKATDRKAKDNFYSSETVMEQILVGLQEVASDSLDDAYSVTLQQYSELSAENRQNTFCTRYCDNVRTRLQGSSSGTYNIATIESFIDASFFDQNYLQKTEFEDDANPYTMDVYSDHVVLRNLTVKFTDPATDYTSIITTDFRIDVPDMNFTQSSTMPDLFSFSLVAGDQLCAAQGVTTDIYGNVFGGENGMNFSINDKVAFKDAKLVITEGTISMNGLGTADNAATLQVGEDGTTSTRLWADGIRMDGGSCTLNGQSFIQDDLSIDGSGGTVKLNGEYYGYGNSVTDSAKSSAILINSKNSSLDLSELNKILIGGRSYVGTGTVSDNGDVLMGESIAVKGNQVAYLVPAQCIGVLTTDGEQKVIFGKNPLTGAEYTKMLEYMQTYEHSSNPLFEEVAFNRATSILGGTTLNQYGASFKKVFVPGNGDTLVYYYLEMDSVNAEKFFQDYYGISYNKEKLDQYFQFYTKGIKTKDVLTDYSRINIEGNWLVDTTEDASGVKRQDALHGDETALAAESVKYGTMFSGYCAKLTPYYELMSEEEKTKSVFDNMILRKKLTTYTGTGRKKFTKEGSDLNAVLVNGDANYPGDSSIDENTRLIVATGDVTVTKDFNGLIIAAGNINIETNAVVKPNKEDLARVLQYTDSTDDTITPISFFVNGSDYVIDGTSISVNEATDDQEAVNLNEIVRYENWKKK